MSIQGSRGVMSAFSNIVIAALIVAALALAIGSTINETSVTYNVNINSSSFTNISNTGNQIIGVTNTTANNFFGNQTSTTGSSSIDRMVSGAYGTILIVGQVPDVYVNSVESVSNGIGIANYTPFVIAGIVAIIIGVGIYLAVGRT